MDKKSGKSTKSSNLINIAYSGYCEEFKNQLAIYKETTGLEISQPCKIFSFLYKSIFFNGKLIGEIKQLPLCFYRPTFDHKDWIVSSPKYRLALYPQRPIDAITIIDYYSLEQAEYSILENLSWLVRA